METCDVEIRVVITGWKGEQFLTFHDRVFKLLKVFSCSFKQFFSVLLCVVLASTEIQTLHFVLLVVNQLDTRKANQWKTNNNNNIKAISSYFQLHNHISSLNVT
ncbi:unnamed protein product [Schistosoma margrebowiei]|uniref:Uncharacterized protein n=1 Tax=Schistosoma margrebowiei TaxID=48269 RepID=A0A183LT37_9TREM|nr:unnamed protein product [Schistosoma margrebowiei]